MIDKCVRMLIYNMAVEGLIKEKESENYQYTLVSLFETCIVTGTILLISLIMKQIVGISFFLLFFFLLRRRTGGYHAKTFTGCYAGSVLLCMGIMLVGPLLSEKNIVMYVVVLGSLVVIYIIGSVNHPNMHMSSMELAEEKRRSRIIIIFEYMIITIFLVLDIKNEYVSYMSMAIILCALLLILAKILKQEDKGNGKREEIS